MRQFFRGFASSVCGIWVAEAFGLQEWSLAWIAVWLGVTIVMFILISEPSKD